MVTPLKALRIERGLVAADLALAVGVREPTINRIENGKSANPALADRIAKYFGNAITRDQILFPHDYPTPAAKKPSRQSAQLQEAS